ncbi:ornithine carbamoyltransferase [Pseudomonas aeruginosa]|nr:ornithine carbamoyltransferase [Pseudomonas aeruginosa]
MAWIGDGNNMCNSYIEAALKFDFQLRVACPEGYEPKAEFVALAGDRLRVVRDPREAVAGAHLVSTDVWASMGQEDEAAARIALFRPYQVNAALLDGAADDVLFMHCLPAHRGEEISEELLGRPALGSLGPGREPSARAEGPPRIADRTRPLRLSP